MKLLLRILTISLLIFGINYNAFGTIKIDPSRYNLELKKGAKFTGKFVISDVDKNIDSITIQPKKWIQYGYNYDVEINEWLKFAKYKITNDLLQKEKEIDLGFDINVPNNAYGELMAMISFILDNRKMIDVQTVISIPIYVKVKGTIRKDLEIS
ncbi:hypothetical protein ACFL4A_03535, partial [bacterium]